MTKLPPGRRRHRNKRPADLAAADNRPDFTAATRSVRTLQLLMQRAHLTR